MFNLLPQNIKNRIIKEYSLRRLIVIFAFVLCLQILFVIFIFPTWYVSSSNERSLALETQDLNNYLVKSDSGKIASTINDINTKIKLLNTTLEYPKVIPIINKLISYKNKDIHITEIVFNAVSSMESSINIKGVATDRETLLSFFKSLQNDKTFSKADLPISNFAKDKNIDFSINISTKS